MPPIPNHFTNYGRSFGASYVLIKLPTQICRNYTSLLGLDELKTQEEFLIYIYLKVRIQLLESTTLDDTVTSWGFPQPGGRASVLRVAEVLVPVSFTSATQWQFPLEIGVHLVTLPSRISVAMSSSRICQTSQILPLSSPHNLTLLLRQNTHPFM
jgi:hypothetical protein